MGNWGLMYSFSACMTSKISQLKFGPNHVPRLRLSGAPISPSNLFTHCIIKGAQTFHCTIKGPISRFPIRSFSHCSFPIALFNKGISPIASSKDPKFSIASSQRTPNFPLRHQGPQFPHHVIKLMTSNLHVIKDGSQFIIASSRGPPFPPSMSSKGTKISKIHHVYNLWDMHWLKSAVFKIISDKRAQSLHSGVHSHNSLFIFLNRKPIQIFLIPKLISLSRFLIILNKQCIVLMRSSHFNKILVKNE